MLLSMKMMNKSEQKAYTWLVSQGHKGIVFNGRTSPDFATESGIGFEVKTARNGVVLFSDSQWETLEQHPHVRVVIFNDADAPLAIAEFSELPKPPSYWRQFRLLMNCQRRRALAARIDRDRLIEPEVLKLEEAAEYLRINREVLRRLSEAGKMQGAYRVGKQWRYVKAELLKEGG